MVAADLPAGWFLENAWLIPLIPGLAFFLILLAAAIGAIVLARKD